MKVLVIDDSPDIKEVVSLCFQLRWNDAQIIPASNGSEGVRLAEKAEPDMVILDLGLPDIDGFQVLKEVRSFSRVPIVVLTVRDRDVDVARALELGADEYITKPFSHIELVARVQAVLRRSQGEMQIAEERPFTNGSLYVDFGANIVRVSGDTIRLTSTERKILYALVRNHGRLLTHEDLLVKVWGDAYVDARDMLRVHIQHLRQKLGDNSTSPSIIITEHGLGYKFAGI